MTLKKTPSPTTSRAPPSSTPLPGHHPIARHSSGTSYKVGTPNHSIPQQAAPKTPESGDDATWGANFWVTLVDPQTQTSFFACPATGQVSWDPPVGNFVLPPSTEGEWWELSDDSRGGLSYYYQTKTGETVWERPSGFVIPLGIIQNTALGRRLSQTTFDRFSKRISASLERPEPLKETLQLRSPSNRPALENNGNRQSIARSASGGDLFSHGAESVQNGTSRFHTVGSQLTPIPGSPYATDRSVPSSPSSSKKSTASFVNDANGEISPSKKKDSPNGKGRPTDSLYPSDYNGRARSKSSSYTSHRPQQPQSLHAALEMISTSHSDSGHTSQPRSLNVASSISDSSMAYGQVHSGEDSPSTHSRSRGKRDFPPSPQRPIPSVPQRVPTVGGKGISSPIMNHAATLELSPVKNRATGQPILVGPIMHPSASNLSTATLNTGTYPILPSALAMDIQQFSESDYAKQYFSTHRSGFIFRRRVPVAQLMAWQKAPLTSPLLVLNRTLHKDAVKVFKVIQHIMGDREREKSINIRLPHDGHLSAVASFNSSTTSLSGNSFGLLEEERWVLSEGLTHGELRDEIYCQLMKQLTTNPNTESIFKGWQLLCVLLITFPPSKNFETYLHAFIQNHTTYQESRVDVMAKYCLRRLASISMKGPRGKPPSIAEIETASDAAFNPSTFGESLDAIIRLQERNYPHQKVPIILPFLADGILALGGPRSEGIFRVPGDNDSVSELKLRIDRGYYTLDAVDDPHVLASLMKLWLRELCDPLVPSEMYNECIQHSRDHLACIRIVERLPTINRRVVLFVISFLQLFLEERTQSITKMTPANLALVMAPNLLRCSSDAMSVVFTNAQYEQIFVYNLLLHLRCDEIDTDYQPAHGLGAVPSVPTQKTNRTRSRRPNP